MKISKTAAALTGVTGVLIVLGIVIALNVVLGAVRLRKDLTEDRIYTLSKGTKNLLGELERDVTLKLYYSKSNPSIPVPTKQYAQRVADLLQEYAWNGGGRVVVET